MPIELKLRRMGNSIIAEIPEEALTLLDAGEGDSLFLVKTAAGIRIYAKEAHFAKTMEAAAEGMQKYRDALRQLAD